MVGFGRVGGRDLSSCHPPPHGVRWCHPPGADSNIGSSRLLKGFRPLTLDMKYCCTKWLFLVLAISSLHGPWGPQHSVSAGSKSPLHWQLLRGLEMFGNSFERGRTQRKLFFFFILINQDPTFIKGMIIKAKALYSMCMFEHALVLFTKADLLTFFKN